MQISSSLSDHFLGTVKSPSLSAQSYRQDASKHWCRCPRAGDQAESKLHQTTDESTKQQPQPPPQPQQQ